MAFGKHLLALVVAAVIAHTAAAPAAAATTAPIAAPGIPIYQVVDGSSTRCTLGYTARNAEGQRLAVTAGHCGTLGDTVYDNADRPIGTYIAVQPDDVDTRTYGYSIIQISPDVALSAWITPTLAIERHAQARPGDYVCLFGTTSGRRCSTVETLTATEGTITGNLSNGGDSGGPVLRMRDRALIGIVIGHNNTQTLFEPVAGIVTQAAANAAIGTAFGPVVDDDYATLP
ncbi:S1 family peptidase [Mycolicibacterium conceptionense]|uniref:S1 family peptidase n=1 Tax=Mycolicibacterium conceptionense TaxID=451644 RepID=UPI003204C553